MYKFFIIQIWVFEAFPNCLIICHTPYVARQAQFLMDHRTFVGRHPATFMGPPGGDLVFSVGICIPVTRVSDVNHIMWCAGGCIWYKLTSSPRRSRLIIAVVTSIGICTYQCISTVSNMQHIRDGHWYTGAASTFMEIKYLQGSSLWRFDEAYRGPLNTIFCFLVPPDPFGPFSGPCLATPSPSRNSSVLKNT